MNATVRRARGFILLTVVLALALVAALAFLLNRGGGMNMSMAARGLEADRARYVAEAGLARINYETQKNGTCTGFNNLGNTPFGADSFSATVNPNAGSPVTFSAIGTTAGGAAATLTRNNVATYGALSSPPLVLQSADATGIDTWLSSGHVALNYGATVALTLSYPNNDRALLRFDLSGIPIGSRISSASLQLMRQNASGGDVAVSLYRVTTRWTAGFWNGLTPPGTFGATYTKSNGTSGNPSWSTPGGDYDPAAIDSVATTKNPGWKSWDATSLVQGWVDESYANYGMILIPTAGGRGDFTSSDMAPATVHPQLVVSYYPRCSLGPVPVVVGTAGNFVILTKTGITDVPPSAINGNIGTSPITGAAITGMTCAEVTEFIFTVDAAGPVPCTVTDPTSLTLTRAVADMQTAYTDAAGRAPGVGSFLNVGAGTLANQTLVPGTYTWTSPVTITTDLTLSGGPNDVWIFQIHGPLDMAAAKNVILVGGARARNIFWQVDGPVTLHTTSHFEGIVLAHANVAMQAGASINGRLLAQTAVTLQQNAVTQPLP